MRALYSLYALRRCLTLLKAIAQDYLFLYIKKWIKKIKKILNNKKIQ